MDSPHNELLREALKAPKGATGLPPVIAALHRKHLAAIRLERERRKAGGKRFPWGPGSQPEDEPSPR